MHGTTAVLATRPLGRPGAARKTRPPRGARLLQEEVTRTANPGFSLPSTVEPHHWLGTRVAGGGKARTSPSRKALGRVPQPRV